MTQEDSQWRKTYSGAGRLTAPFPYVRALIISSPVFVWYVVNDSPSNLIVLFVVGSRNGCVPITGMTKLTVAHSPDNKRRQLKKTGRWTRRLTLMPAFKKQLWWRCSLDVDIIQYHTKVNSSVVVLERESSIETPNFAMLYGHYAIATWISSEFNWIPVKMLRYLSPTSDPAICLMVPVWALKRALLCPSAV